MHALQPYAEHEYTVKVETISSKFTTLNSSRISKVLFALEPEKSLPFSLHMPFTNIAPIQKQDIAFVTTSHFVNQSC